MQAQSARSAFSLMVLSHLIFSIRVVMIKAAVLAEAAVHPGPAHFGAAECWLVISGISFLLTLSRARRTPEVWRACGEALAGSENRRLLLFRGMTGAAADILILCSSMLIPMAMSTLLQSSHVFFLMLFSMLILKEGARLSAVLCAVMGYVGVCLALAGQMQPGMVDGLAPSGVVAGILGAITTAVGFLAVRRVRHLPSALPMMSLQLGNVLVSLGVLCWKGVHLPSAPLTLALLGLGFLPEVAAEAVKIRALRLAPASTVASSAFARPVFSGIMGLILFGEHLSGMTQAGMATVIVFGLLLPALQVRRQPADVYGQPQRI